MIELNIYQKLIEVRKAVPYLKKEAQGKQYNYTGSSQVLSSVREKMDELGLLLIPRIISKQVSESAIEFIGDNGHVTKRTITYFTELDLTMTWVNADKPDETIECPWYGQGVDIAGEKGVGKALTYAEKYFILKQFNIATDKDDPDAFQEKAEQYRKPEPITSKEIGLLKTKVLEFATLREKSDTDVYKVLGVADVTGLSSKEAKEILAKLTGWITSATKELAKKEKKGA
ncbi:ERF family protein [Mesobacillus zeae]|uniref:Single-stranded DNA-binding protein n=1 Tax=Mesobacillus zeae TaxID=1917180 RepID=A0A398BDA5_9BACI|nr:ERF family protein [Mesobacillus zeae]RID85636.1 single-stranded DNA-binding protein [Mesobacillus zeae]